MSELKILDTHTWAEVKETVQNLFGVVVVNGTDEGKQLQRAVSSKYPKTTSPDKTIRAYLTIVKSITKFLCPKTIG